MDEAALGVVGALVGVRAEGVALRLREVLLQARRAAGVEVAESRRERRKREAGREPRGDDLAPRIVRAIENFGERSGEHEAREIAALLIGVHDLVEESGADDAAGFPDPSHLPRIDLPAVHVRAFL